MTREADLHFLTRAGIEIGVASTKAFITQLTAIIFIGAYHCVILHQLMQHWKRNDSAIAAFACG